MVNNYIKWGIIQPLTGGMYFGARNAIGHKADWILSYPELDSVKTDKNGNMTSVGNEYNLLKWCETHNELPPYKVFNRKPFDSNMSTDVELLDTEWYSGDIDLSNTDIVLSVPVCAGLSAATIASDETKDKRNCNMIWNTRYALGVIQPKIYIFENAPALFAAKGEHVRDMLNSIGEEYGYSVIYYKTDTKFHDNCQRRPRTFVVFVKYNNGEGAPTMGYESLLVSVKDFFERLPEGLTQQECIELPIQSQILMDYIKHKWGNDYRQYIRFWAIGNVIDNNLWGEFIQYIKDYNCSSEAKEKFIKQCDHMQYKLSLGKNFYCLLPNITFENDPTIPACMFKNIQTYIHYKEDRLYTIREWLHTMGMPNDFEMYGDINVNYQKIGQNVPARTAQFITSEAVKIIKNWDSIDRTDNIKIKFFDNTKI